MKTTLFCILLLLSGIVSAQTIDHPSFKARSGSISNITRIERTAENTRVYIHAIFYVPALRASEPLAGAYASIAELNKLSAPIKGNGGVFVLQPYAKEKLNETFNQETEEATLQNMHARMASQFLNDLYLKADVKDSRYLFF